MPSLHDVLHWQEVAALLAAYVAPKDAVSLVVWAIDAELHDGARALLAHRSSGCLGDLGDAIVLRCAAASGFRVATLRLLSCGSLDAYASLATPPEKEIVLPTFAAPPLAPVAMYTAAKRGDLEAVAWLHPLTKYEPHEAMAAAAAGGHLKVARWLGERAMVAALDPLRPYETDLHYLLSYDFELLALTWTVEYVNTNNQRVHRKYLATAGGHVAPVQTVFGWATEREYSGAMDIVAGQGNLGLLAAMHDDQAVYAWSCTSAAMDNAAANGHVHVLEWLSENRSEGYTQAAMDGAARGGHVEALKWLDANCDELRITTDTFLAALEGGHIDALAWLHKRRPVASLPETLAVEAACTSNNSLTVLKWLADTRGIRTASKAAMSKAIRRGDKPTAQWLALATAGAKHIELWNRVVAMWMSYEFKLMHDDTFAQAALQGHVEMVAWLALAGPFYKVDGDTLWRCAMRGHLDVVAFILTHPANQGPKLECLPASRKARLPCWTSFCDAYPGKNTGSTHGDWQPLAFDPAWAKPYVELWLEHRPQDVKQVAWLPEWARICGHVELHEQLKEL